MADQPIHLQKAWQELASTLRATLHLAIVQRLKLMCGLNGQAPMVLDAAELNTLANAAMTAGWVEFNAATLDKRIEMELNRNQWD